MEYTRQLIDYFPERIRASIDADEDHLLAHFANAIQPGLDVAIDTIEGEADFYDPELCPAALLDWLGQLVGLARAGNKYLGLGLNPAWSNARKRQAIARAWQYWQIKGTRLGLDEAISIWLDWEPSGRHLLDIRKPFGDTPSHTPPQWAGWGQPYYQELIEPYRSVRRWGGGDLPQPDYLLSNYRYLPPVGAEFTPSGFVPISVAPGSPNLVADINAGLAAAIATMAVAIAGLATRVRTRSTGAANASNRPWQHFQLDAGDWNRIVPDISQLNPEIWSARIDPVPFAWLDLTPIPVEQTGPIPINLWLDKANWQLTIVTADDAYVAAPTVSHLIDPSGRGKFERSDVRETQYLEFIIAPLRPTTITRLQVTYRATVVFDLVLPRPLALDPAVRFGVCLRVRAAVGAPIPTVGVVLDPQQPTVGVTLDLPTVGVLLDLPTVGVVLDTPTVGVSLNLPTVGVVLNPPPV